MLLVVDRQLSGHYHLGAPPFSSTRHFVLQQSCSTSLYTFLSHGFKHRKKKWISTSRFFGNLLCMFSIFPLAKAVQMMWHAASKMALSDFCLLIFVSLCNLCPWYEGCTYWFASNMQNDEASLLRLGYKRLTLSDSFYLLDLVKHGRGLWRGPCGKELRVPTSQQPVKNWEPQPNSFQWIRSWQ